MKYEIFVVRETKEKDRQGNKIYENKSWDVKGNIWHVRSYAAKHNYGAGVGVYDDRGELKIIA